MAVLRERQAWRAERRPWGPELTQDEVAHVKAALDFLRRRDGTFRALAEAMGLKKATIQYAAGKGKRASAGVALRAARAAGVPVEDILSGVWPKPETCPHCGRGGDR